MNRQDKVKHIQSCIIENWPCPQDSFSKNENIILETDKKFFEIITFGHNAVIRADKNIVSWCIENFSKTPAAEILDGKNLFLIEKKMREYGKKLGGEHTRFLHLEPEPKVEKPQGLTYEWFEKDCLHLLYSDKRFENALNYHYEFENLALVAKKDNEIVAIAAAADYYYGLWEIGIDTLDSYRDKGIAAYLVKEMALEAERRSKFPYYTTWMANIASVRTAIRAGFLPVWIWHFAEDI